jgi:hypothetical protein
MAENSETVRGRRRRRRRRRGGGGRIFVVPRPGATLSHLVKIHFRRRIVTLNSSLHINVILPDPGCQRETKYM